MLWPLELRTSAQSESSLASLPNGRPVATLRNKVLTLHHDR